MKEQITGIILAGGESKRMGENKALLKFGGLTVIEIILSKLQKFFGDILIITNTPESFEELGIEIFEDIYPGFGPLSGIHSGLTNSKTEKCFFISCDLPLVTDEMIDFIINYKTDKNIVLYKNGRYNEKLFGVYSRRCLQLADKLLKESEKDKKTGKQNVSMNSLLSICEKEIINFEALPFYNPESFLNMNTKDEYLRIKELLLK